MFFKVQQRFQLCLVRRHDFPTSRLRLAREQGREREINDVLDISIRVATAADAPLLARARYALRSSTGPTIEDEPEFVRRCTTWMEERLHEGHPWRCWIAEKEHSLVGNVWVQLIEKIPNPAPKSEYYAYLSNFYVNGDVRGTGIGSLLLSVALNWCREQGVHAVILWPTDRSRSLYLRYGFAVRDDVLELLLEE